MLIKYNIYIRYEIFMYVLNMEIVLLLAMMMKELKNHY